MGITLTKIKTVKLDSLEALSDKRSKRKPSKRNPKSDDQSR